MRKLILTLFIAMTLLGYNARTIVGGGWTATDTNQTDTTGLNNSVIDRSFETQILMYMFDVHGTIAEDADTFIFTLEGWLTDTIMSYTKFTIIADTVTVPFDTLLGYDTISNWYIQMCDTFLFLQQTIGDTMGFEPDSVWVYPYLNRIKE